MNKFHYLNGTLIGRSMLALFLLCAPCHYANAEANATTAAQTNQQKTITITGKVTDKTGEGLIGVTVQVKGFNDGVITDIDGNYTIKTTAKSPVLEFSYIGYTTQEVKAEGRSVVNVKLEEESSMLNEVVVTALGIQRKEKSLTYATQQVKSEDLMKVQDPNVANSIEGKVSGVTITPSAGGAGGASKIILRGNKSIMGGSAPLIVVDGVPMTNNTRGQKGMGDGASLTYSSSSEGSDALSLINPDDIASINVLKGANAAALYGSVAANGVLMITTKKGREGVMSVNFSSNLTLDTPLLTPSLQNTYGAAYSEATGLGITSWGDRLDSRSNSELIVTVPGTNKFFNESRQVYLRNQAGNDMKDFFETGMTTNNSVSLSGGTEKVKSYFSYGNSHSNGMLPNNSYNRNTFNLRENFRLFDRVSVDVNANYVSSNTKNRPGGGTVLNPVYHMYTMPRNIDIAHYRNNYAIADGRWMSEPQAYYKREGGKYTYVREAVELKGVMQNWAYMSSMQNNPYWLMNQNNGETKEDRFSATIGATVDLFAGLTFQGRVNFIHDKYQSESHRYATTFLPASMEDFGHLWKTFSKTSEIYTDYMLSYNKEFGDYSVSASAGWVGHTSKGESQTTSANATWQYGRLDKPSDVVNYFETNAGGRGATTTSYSSTWDKGAFFTAQIGWKDKVYLDGSYRRDWYREYRRSNFKLAGVPDNYGYFGFGANAIVSEIVKLPEWFNYMKYRLSYSEVGNSIPNSGYVRATTDFETGTVTTPSYSQFTNPSVETAKSIETGLEMMFLKSRLSVDLTYYNTTMHDLYMQASNASGKVFPMNSGRVRNQGVEATVGYDFRFGKSLSWRTAYNVSYNDNKILETAYNKDGSEMLIAQDVSNVRVRYREGGSIGDMYVTDFKRDENGYFILTPDGKPQLETEANKKFGKYVGNMNSKWQMGWSNNIKYKEFTLYFLVNGRIGGKVASLTEATLDKLGLSERTGAAREYAEANNIWVDEYSPQPQLGMELPDGSGRLVPIQAYYEAIGSTPVMTEYMYSGTNFRLRELSLGYTFRNLMGLNKNLTLSFVARNLFFLYKDAPTDPDVSLSTSNGLGAFEAFNMPSSRSFGFSLSLNL